MASSPFDEDMTSQLMSRVGVREYAEARRKKLMQETAYLRGSIIQYIDHHVIRGTDFIGIIISYVLRIVIMIPIGLVIALAKLLLLLGQHIVLCTQNIITYLYADSVTPVTSVASVPATPPISDASDKGAGHFMEVDDELILEDYFLEEAYSAGKSRPKPKTTRSGAKQPAKPEEQEEQEEDWMNFVGLKRPTSKRE